MHYLWHIQQRWFMYRPSFCSFASVMSTCPCSLKFCLQVQACIVGTLLSVGDYCIVWVLLSCVGDCCIVGTALLYRGQLHCGDSAVFCRKHSSPEPNRATVLPARCDINDGPLAQGQWKNHDPRELQLLEHSINELMPSHCTHKHSSIHSLSFFIFGKVNHKSKPFNSEKMLAIDWLVATVSLQKEC